ncbi:MAG: flagellar motor protein MotB [Pseudomonadota bacterium]
MSDQAPIIIKRKKVVAGGGHHGGAWKVAYADFVTAMMAFFLLMWLLNATTEEQRKGLADYFNPTIPIAAVSGGGSDALNGDSIVTEKTMPQSGDYRSADPRKSVIPQDDTLKAAIEDLATKAGIEDAAGRIIVHQTEEGTVVELVDAEGKPLFASGSSAPSEDLQKLIMSTAEVIKKTGADIKVTGHTDGISFARNGYTNWELSADRANTARRLLLNAGIKPEMIKEVAGRADRDPIGRDRNDPVNRRIAIILQRPDPLQATALR